MKRKLISLITALALCLSLCPVGALGADVSTPGDTGSTTTPGDTSGTTTQPLTDGVTIKEIDFTGTYKQTLMKEYDRAAVTAPKVEDFVFVGDDGKYYSTPQENSGLTVALGTVSWYSGHNITSSATALTSVPMDAGNYTLEASVTVYKEETTPPASSSGVDTTTQTTEVGTFSCKQEFSIAQREIKPVLRSDIKKAYDGTANYTAASGASPFDNDGSGILGPDQSSVTITAQFHFADSSVGKKEFSATGVGLAGERAGNYKIASGITITPVTAEIVKAQVPSASSGTILVRNRQKRDYVYELKNLLPALTGDMSYGKVEYAIKPPVQVDLSGFFAHPTDVLASKDIELKDGQLTLHIENAQYSNHSTVGAVYLTITSDNFEPFEATLHIESDDRTPVTIFGLTAAARPTYTGSAIQGYDGRPEFKLQADDGSYTDLPTSVDNYPSTLVKSYESTSRSQTVYGPSAEPPTEPGDYRVTVSIPESNPDYAGSWTGDFTITRAKVTVSAKNRTIKIDDPVPTFKNPELGVDYEVQGLAPGHELRLAPTMKYATVADSIMEGEFEILIDGAMVPDNTHYEPAIEYKPGKLTVTSLTVTDENPFSDVTEYTWYSTAVKYVYNRGLMKGVTSTLFDPTGDLTRGMVVTILYRLDGEWPVWNTMPFTDLDPQAYYMDAVRWASSNHIVNGYGDGRFGPDDVLTREQLAIILYNFSRYSGNTPRQAASLDQYVDAFYTTSAGYRALQWACAEGFIQGTGSTTLSPGDKALRAQVAVILMRYCTRYSR